MFDCAGSWRIGGDKKSLEENKFLWVIVCLIALTLFIKKKKKTSHISFESSVKCTGRGMMTDNVGEAALKAFTSISLFVFVGGFRV